MKQLFTFIRKEFYHVFRDKKTLLLLFGMPIAQIVLFGFALTNEIKDADVVICDYSNDISTRKIINKIESNGNFNVYQKIMSHNDIESSFKKGNIKLAIIFPSNFNSEDRKSVV